LSAEQRRNRTQDVGPVIDGSTRQAGRAQGRHAASKLSFLHRKSARFRAAAVAAALVGGVAAYMAVTISTPATSALTATVPPGGYTLDSGDALVAVGSGTKESSGRDHGAVIAQRAAVAVPSPPVAASAVAPSPAAPVPAARPALALLPVATPTVAPSRSATPTVAPSRAATTAPATSTPAATLTCNTSYGLLPENVTAIVSFLLAHGYSDNAAAGIAGNIYQESKGNPESEGAGGGGLIGWTPLPAGYVTGDPAADLQTQLSAILSFNEQWSQYLPELNSAATPADAAYIYVTDFERAGIPAAATREAAATDVARACGI
jgi:hypothetical protein